MYSLFPLALQFLLLSGFYQLSIFGQSLAAGPENAEIGKNFTLQCFSNSKNTTWTFNNKELSRSNKRYKFAFKETISDDMTDVANDISEKSTSISPYEHSLTILSVAMTDQGTFACKQDDNFKNIASLQPIISPKIVASNSIKVKQKIKHGVTLYCLFEIYPPSNATSKVLKWLKDDTSIDFLDSLSSLNQINATHVNFTLEMTEVYKKENGTYACVAYAVDGQELARKETVLLVMDLPQVSIDYAKAVGSSKIYLNWTVNDGNDPVLKYFVQYALHDTQTFDYYKDFIGGGNTSYVLDYFKPNSSYLLRLLAKNNIGEGAHHQYHLAVRTLETDPIFVPKVESTGSTASTITIGWDPPPAHLLPYVQYYELVVAESGETRKVVEETIYQQNSRNLPYMFDNLKTATDYEFMVRACSDLTKLCGPWSDTVNGTTMDGAASEPTDLRVSCLQFNASDKRTHSVNVNWNAPNFPNGKVVSYQIKLEGYSNFMQEGKRHNETWGPKIRRVEEPQHKTVYDSVPPNTNYSVTISAITRHRRFGDQAVAKCTMPVSVPDQIGRIVWTKVKTSENKCVLKLIIPKISERNGPICCYRLYLVRMANINHELPPPTKLNISTYEEVHSLNNSHGGAYVAEMFSSNDFKSEIFLGDGRRFFDNRAVNADTMDTICRKCLEGQEFLRVHKTPHDVIMTNIPTPIIPPELSQRDHLNKASNLTEAASKILENKKRKRKRRNPKVLIGESQSLATENSIHENIERIEELTKGESSVLNLTKRIDDIFDGEIDMNSNYTGFLEIIVRDQNTVFTAFSNYFEIITPGTEAEQIQSVDDMSALLNNIIQILAVLIGIILVLLIALCFMHHYKAKHTGPGEEVISLRDSLSRALFGGRSGNHHRHFIGANNVKASDVGPISKVDLYKAYKERHKDTDYGFLREYEMLPNRFSDRTTKNSDMKENSSKNRYPDIKAYDQTRVKLAQINAIQGSDYVNANFVIGYKERKKFICAQGPMEGTINDFWRMIWEQHLEIIIMLTNLEEYNKSKCAKYWPENISDSRLFGDITVKFGGEKKMGDYLVRNFDINRRNCANEDEEERRQITQYHYLAWKDFMAPEHPHGIIKFIRQVNSVYSVQRGPILVHCSAGVGRTGTLVALDSLMHQLEEEEQVSIFNTVCDLRHQRNFLVQSLKQYIFLYRALLDTAHFGNTELRAISLSSTIDSLKVKPEGRDKCKLEVEFERLLTVADETNKAITVASCEDNSGKNRSADAIPYDRNRVILTPIPLKDNSTYINASFIEGYENSETFIITQDPTENTISDFWRMVSEQSIPTVVMISEIGDSPRKCPRYWADDEIQYDHIRIKYMHSESCPYYTRREFNVTNCKIDDTIKVTQFQYNGWPTVDGEVPEVCRGIIELVDQALNHHNKEKSVGCRSPMAVHCSMGTDRSSIFIAMCILVQQLRTEKVIDICSISRKIRCQRPRLLDTYAQYEFLHRAIANYADLHKLSTPDPPSSDC